MTIKLIKLVSMGMAIATLAACGAPETPPIATSPSPTSTVSSSPSPSLSPKVAASPAPVESVAPPVTISSSKATTETTNSANPAKETIATGCQGREKSLLKLTTENYIINICGVTTPEYYVGAEKADPKKSIRLPLTEASPTFIMAVNGDVTYILAQTPRGNFLTVTQGEKELLREVVEGW